jgi:outer membrane lipase/esterase
MRLNVSDARRARAGCAVLIAALLAAACGGGGQQVQIFVASRVIAFGDETSVLDDPQGTGNASKYSVNAVTSSTDSTFACTLNPLWVQILAGHYGLLFPQCTPGSTSQLAPASRIRAAYGAKAADVGPQIDAQIADGGIRQGDMTSVIVGVNDVLEQYAQYPAVGEAQLTANVQAAGIEVAHQVNRLADLGAKVIISTIPDIGYSPFALNERDTHIDTDRAALIGRLVQQFNTSMRYTIYNDGHRIGLVTMDAVVQGAATTFGLYGFTNTRVGVCDLNQSQLTPPSILDCSSLTLITGGNGLTYLWADDRHLSAGGQIQLGNLAAARAANNPF